MKFSKKYKIIGISLAGLAVLLFALYLWILPSVICSYQIQKLVSHVLEKNLGVELNVKNPKLLTGLNSSIVFTVDALSLNKEGKEILNLSNVDSKFSIKKIFDKRLIVNKIIAENIYVDVNKIISLLPQETNKKKKEKSLFFVDIFNALLGVKNCHIVYKSPDYDIDLKAKHIILDNQKERKFLHLDIYLTLQKGDSKICILINDLNKVYVDKHIITIDKLPINIDKSIIIVDAWAKRNKTYMLNVSSKNFSAKDIYDIVNSNIVIQNGKELVKPICNVDGSVNFNFTMREKNNIAGDLSLNKVDLKIKDVLMLPVTLTAGYLSMNSKDIIIRDFKGYYNKNPENKMNMKGDVKDYPKTCYSKLVSEIYITDDFFKNYLSKMLSYPISLVGDASSTLIVETKNNVPNIRWYFLLNEGEGFKLGEQSMVLSDYKTIFKLDLSILKNILKINTLNYYITSEIKHGMIPVLKMDGNFDMDKNMRLLDVNLDIPRPLPSEFLNFLTGQNFFKKGQISGSASIDNRGNVAYIKGGFKLDKVLVPSQRLFIKSGLFESKGNRIIVKSDGRFKRSSYDLNGEILNELKLPIIVKNIKLNVDNIDIEKMLANNSQTQENPQQDVSKIENVDETNSDVQTFTKGLLIVEKCTLNLIKGVYKQINFGNLIADLTLDKEGVLNVKSNRFDIAQGLSSLKASADLVNQKYSLKLGIKDVDSDILATSILSLPREISGKAMGLIDINSDSSLKMNGDIKFKIKDGTIEKVGYVEYILKVASLFRNPLVMISPSVLGDLVNIPEGRFDEIQGELHLKDNVIERMMIKSSADELAAFIIGRYDLDTNDSMLRIYTKVSRKGKGFAGFLRNISLNTLASKLSISSRNEANYYAKELSQIPVLKEDDGDAQVFLTKIDGDVINYNFLSTLKRIK